MKRLETLNTTNLAHTYSDQLRKTLATLEFMSSRMPITRDDPGTRMDSHTLSTVLDSIPQS